MLNRLFLTTALTTLTFSFASLASAQTTIDADTDAPITTEDSGDLTINTGVTVSTTTVGPAVTLNSDNSIINSGSIAIEDVDNATAVDIQGGNTGSFTLEGTVGVIEDFTPADLDDDQVPDEPLALGTGRTGILISGASPFVGDVNLLANSGVIVEGNDSYAIRLSETAGLTGDLNALGSIALTGNNSAAISLESQIIGNLALGGTIAARGTNTSAVNVSADVDGAFNSQGTITNSGYAKRCGCYE